MTAVVAAVVPHTPHRVRSICRSRYHEGRPVMVSPSRARENGPGRRLSSEAKDRHQEAAMTSSNSVVVGVDGSEQALTAARWGLDAAKRCHRTLEVIHSWSIPLPPVGLGPTPVGLNDDSIR